MQGGMRKITGFRDTKLVKYSKCSKSSQHDDDLDDVTVVNSAAPENVKYGTAGCVTANGPRVVPGIITSSGGEMSCMVSSERRSVAGPTTLPYSGGTPATPSGTSDKQAFDSRSSLIDTVTRRVTSSEPYAFVNKAHVGSDLEIPRKTRELRRREIKKDLEKWETSTSGSDRAMCKWTFVFDPSGRLCYYWSVVVSVAFLYNFWVIIYRFAFQEITVDTLHAWFTLDYLADLIYILDIAVHFRTGYLEEGVLQTDSLKLRQHYINSTMFYIDCLCLLPLDCLYLSIGFNSILRCFRLVKIYRFWAFLDRTERHTNYPNVFRALSLTHYVLVIFHWNACLFHIVSKNGGFGSRDWFSPRDARCSDVLCEYLHGFYWSTLALTTIGDLPRPRTRGEYLFLVLELVSGLFLFSAVLGHVANIVTNVSAARKEFQGKNVFIIFHRSHNACINTINSKTVMQASFSEFMLE
ncbi:cyclic nucleotide-gated channel cone photoreceptor subunit alpha-like [Stegodyphus dumicola]|uniref:cyclic nucleotide-gated channel cone photoreceptor subunit alpha-like n=1 Tax=Stegodyphus dumicola TaxID=202533 RepID=UPI0015AC6BBA|nr:cyclic nucleotide-gated channel cone photoreceptor subunit alpha-like [Stegodyphus dumicola]